jgi:hypothetical protein
MNKRFTNLILLFAFTLSLAQIFAQVTTPPTPPAPPAPDYSYKPLTLKLNDDGSKYVRFIMWHQFWVSATQNNPGTRNLNGELIDGTGSEVDGVLTLH